MYQKQKGVFVHSQATSFTCKTLIEYIEVIRIINNITNTNNRI